MTNEQLAILIMSYIRSLNLIEDAIFNGAKGIPHHLLPDEARDLLRPLHSFIQCLHEDRKRLTGEKY